MVKNHNREGKWIEFKSNRFIDLQQSPEFTDPYTYLEAEYKNGLPVGEWKCYKLQKGQLIYTEIYKDGVLDKREFH